MLSPTERVSPVWLVSHLTKDPSLDPESGSPSSRTGLRHIHAGGTVKGRARIKGVIFAIIPLIVACSTYTAISPRLAPTSGTVRLSMNDAGRTETLGPLGAQVTS